MVYLGSWDKILAFGVDKNSEYLPNYWQFFESRFFKQLSIKPISSAILDYFFQTQRSFVDASMTNKTT
jgi:hypothetical protein